MRGVIRWALWIFTLLAALPLGAVTLALLAANTQPGGEWIERTVATLTAGATTLTGLSGRFPAALRLGRLEMRDADGVWLAIDNLALDWSPGRLLSGTVEIGRLEAEHVILERLPTPSPTDEKSDSSFSLPIGVILRRLHVAQFDLGPAVAGKAASLNVDGRAMLASLEQGDIDLSLQGFDGKGTYNLQGSLKDTLIHSRLSLREPAQGLISSFANFQESASLSAEATLDGPLPALQIRLELVLGPLQAKLQGQLDLQHNSADVTVNAKAPAMQLRPDLSWQAVALDAHVQGPFTLPTGSGKLRIDTLNFAETSLRNLTVNLQGDAGEVGLVGEIAGLRLPGPQPDLLKAAPLSLQADMRLDVAQRPVTFKLKHPLLAVEGKADTATDPRVEAVVNLPELKLFAALGGVDAQGQATLKLKANKQGETAKLDVDGGFNISGCSLPCVNLLGNQPKIGISATVRGNDVALSRFSLDGKALAFSAEGQFAKQSANFNWKLLLKDFAAAVKGGSGQIAAQGQLLGPLDKLAVTAELNGELALPSLPRGPVAAKLRLEGMPNAPLGQLTANALLGGAPFELALTVKALTDGSIELLIDRADWKSVHAKAYMTLPKGANWPVGRAELQMARLDELKPMLDLPVAGSINALLETALQGNRPRARLQLDARNAGLAGSASAGQTSLTINVSEPFRQAVVDGQIKLDGISVGNVSGSAQMDLAGTLEALKLQLSATFQNVAGAEIQLNSSASLNTLVKQAAISELQASWKSETVKLLAPVRIGFADGLTVDRLRLGLRQAELEVAGRISPTLNLNATVDNLPAGLAMLFVPELAITGVLHADAKLGGTFSRPTGAVSIEATDIQMQTGIGHALPTVKLTATAQLNGATAQLSSRFSAGGNANLGITGEVPLEPSGQIDLHAAGGGDLKLLDSLLTAQGRRMRGQVTLSADVTGTLSEPSATGSLQLSDGEVQDFAIGAHLSHLNAVLQAEGGVIRINKFEGRAGSGTVSATGSLDWLAEGMPVNLTLTARKARPLADDQMTVNLDTDLVVKGQANGQLAITGNVHINRAEIRIPERLPAKIAVLKVTKPGMAPPSPPPPGPAIGLDLTMEAPGEIFVRGRGLDAELGGNIHVRGTVAKPQPDGGFAMRRGQFSLAGQALTFSKGEVGFDGGSLTDPSLNFVANTTSANVTATLAVTGNVSNPKIKLSSTPELPQDEVLARLLFGRSATSLSPLEMVQIASALASLTGITSGLGDPLETVRQGLGLDRLSIGGANPTLEAGRYVAPGVYVGAKQGVTGTGTQGTVQIDITKNLKVEGTAGTGTSSGSASGTTSTNSVGVIYQREY